MNKIMLLASALLLLGLSACMTPEDVTYSNTHPPYGDWTQR
jgi:hypothetical protein